MTLCCLLVDVIEAINSSYRYLDDDNVYFEKNSRANTYVPLNFSANSFDTEVPFSNLDM